MENKICVYAIAKNEEKNVVQWYESMKEADKVIVLDTGSTDNTVSLLYSLGVTVHVTSYDNFAFDKARNDALALVPEEYNILVSTDLDEVFEPGWAEILREEWIEGKHEHAQYAYTWDHLGDGSNGHTFPYNKIHSRNWCWRDAIHETLCRIDTGEREYTIEECLDVYDKIHLHHYQDLTINRDWYIKLAEDRARDNPQDKLAHLELIREYCAKKVEDKAIVFGKKILKEHFDLFDEIEVASIYHQMGLCAINNEDLIEAISYFTNGISHCLEYRDNYVELANTYFKCGLYEMSVGIIKECFVKTINLNHWTESSLAFSWLPYNIISAAYYNLGQYKDAYINSSIALSYEPTNENLLNQHDMFLTALLNADKIKE